MTLGFGFHPEARAEFFADVDWYDGRQSGLGERFGSAVRSAVDDAVGAPESWPTWPGWDREPVIRSKAVANFPYRVVYFVHDDQPGHGAGGVLDVSSGFDELCQLWLADLDLRDISQGTKQNYRDDLRRYVRPAFEHYTLGEITTGRVEWFLRREAALSYGRAKHTRTLLNQLFAFAQRHDAIARNPVEGTSPLTRPRHEVHAMTLEQVQAIRAAAAAWRNGPDVKGPRPDGKVRDICEVLLGTSMRPGEALGLRPCDVVETRTGMVVHVQGTVVRRTGRVDLRQDHPKT